MSIQRITRTYVRHCSDSEQTKVYVEWLDQRGRRGRTEGPCCATDGRPLGWHMEALLNRARREGIPLEQERW